MTSFKTILGGFALLASLTTSAYVHDAMIGNDTAPGTVLQSGIYGVEGVVKINATDEPGVSALRVAPGATVTIDLLAGSSLTVIGGNAVGMVGAGAGIEVPADAKLLICGAGLLTAQGGNASSGSVGRAGEDGEQVAFFNVKEEGEEDPDNLPDPLLCMITGAGGDGGNGGGGAGAAIGGRGGRGGVGGAGGAARPIVDVDIWNGTDKKMGTPNNEVYKKWLTLLGHDVDKTLFVYNEEEQLFGMDGLDGAKGGDGKAGGKCGEIVIGEYVQVIAIPGMAGAAGAGGPHGKAESGPELDVSKLVAKVVFEAGLEILQALMSDDDDDKDDDDEDDEDDETEGKEEILWAFGGGGGGGGAGGAGAPQGIGPGGAGGAGGGGAGGGLFAYGANASEDEVEMNGGAGLGGEGVIVMTIEGEDGEEDTVITTHGEKGEESDPVDILDEDGEEQTFYNTITNAVDGVELIDPEDYGRLLATSLKFDEDDGDDDREEYFFAGLGGEGGAVGKVLTLGDRKFFVSQTAAVLVGLEEENQQSFTGDVIIALTLGDTTTLVPCGPIVSPVPVPEAGKKFFMGYFTKEGGEGDLYYDCLGNPVGQHELWEALTLYPHFVDTKPDNIFTINLGEIASVWVQKGKTLPIIGSKILDKMRGWRITSAYIPGETKDDLEDEWYDEDGLPVKEDDKGNPYVYDKDADTKLEVDLEPKWEAMAEMPEDGVRFVYTGKGFSGVDLNSDEYEVVGGVSVATNVGSYATTIRMKDGYEIWDDFLEHSETATNFERTVTWTIDRAELDRLTLPNRVYDWTKTNSTFEVVGKIPAGVTVTYEPTKYLGNGTVEIKAIVNGGENYRSKTMVATWTIPELIRIKNVVSHYPWDTKVQLDVMANPLYAEGVYTNRLKSVIMPMTEDGYKFTDEAIKVEDILWDKGTILLDLRDALANGRKTLSIYMAIDDLPCSCAVQVAADTTATMVQEGKVAVPTYTITDPAQVLPINHSWRIAAEAFHSEEAETTLEIKKDSEVVTKAFHPVNPAGARVNDGVVGWVPQENGDYTLTMKVCEGRSETTYVAYFKVNYPEGTPLPIVAYVGEAGYPTLAAAVAAAAKLTGAARQICIVGDVQTEEVRLPDGEEAIAVVYERGGVFDATRQFLNPENQKPAFNTVNALTGYTWEEGVDIVSAERPPVPPKKATDDFKAVAVVGFPDGTKLGLMEICDNCNIAQVTTGAGALADGNFVFTAYAVAKWRMSGTVALRGADGTLQSLPGKLALPLYGTGDLKTAFAPCGTLELTDGAFEMAIPDGMRFFTLSLGSAAAK